MNKEKKLERERKKNYNKMMRQHKKAMKKVCKNFRPWDYDFIFDLLQEMLHWNLDYCTQDYNILQNEESLRIRVESLTKACKYIDDIINDAVDEPWSENIDKLYADLFDTMKTYIEYWWD